jgi:DNA-binding PadR family transcriptional regulator
MKSRDADELIPLAGGAAEIADAGSAAAWLVLGLIIALPSHGYELYQRYEGRFGEYLPLSRSGLYALLDRLRAAKMVEEIVLEPVGGSRKQHDLRRSYRATRAGAYAYRRWVAERLDDDSQWPQLLGRIASASLLGLDTLVDFIDRYKDESMQTMKVLPTVNPEDQHDNVDELVDSLVADKRRREIRARVDWAIYARQTVRLHAERAIAARESES